MSKIINTVDVVTTEWADVRVDELVARLRSYKTELTDTAADVIEVLLDDVKLYKAMSVDEPWWRRTWRWLRHGDYAEWP